MRDFQLPGRSTAYAGEAMAATSHPLATLTALETLRRGGNAMDAAIAAVAVQCVVEPAMTGVGGDCFVLYAPKGGAEVIGYNGSGRAPAAVGVEALRAKGVRELGAHGVHTVTVPGCVEAWERLAADHGTMELGALLAPAIEYAEEGFPVMPRVARDWAGEVGRLAQDPGARAHYLVDGRAPKAGDRHRLPLLAETLRRIARHGARGFYTGPTAEDIVGFARGLGGFHALEDFAAHKGEYVAPISAEFRGVTIHQCPPNGQGIIVLIMLNTLSGFELGRLDPAGVERLHLEVEAGRLAFSDRDAYVADPAKAEVPVAALLKPERAARRRALIQPDRRIENLPPPVLPGHNDTIYLCVVDRDRNAVSFINSVFDGFGTGKVAPGSGVVLHNRGSSFSMDPGHPNCIAGGKRPMHTIIPGMATRDGKCICPFGVMGAHYQPVGQTRFLTNWLDFGMDPQQAIDFPRAHFRHGAVQMERGYRDEVMAGMAALGHPVARSASPLGGGQAILIDWQRGMLVGGSDPRKDGLALGY